jgi:hypothetical protein
MLETVTAPEILPNLTRESAASVMTYVKLEIDRWFLGLFF